MKKLLLRETIPITRKVLVVLAVAILTVMVTPKPAYADFSVTVGPATSCTTACFGGTYTVNWAPSGGTNSFLVTMTAVTPSSGTVAGQYISAIEFGDSLAITSATLASAPGGTGKWPITVIGNLNNANCNEGNANNVCSPQSSPFNQALANGGTYVWTWNVTYAGTLKQNPDDIHIGLKYADSTGSNGHIVSVNGAGIPVPIPEPATMLLFGSGLLSVAVVVRRRLGV